MDETWSIEKNHGLLSAAVFFAIPAILFLITFTLNYLLFPASDIFSLLLPLIFLPIAAVSFPGIVRSLREFPEKLEFRLNDEGVSRRVEGGEWQFLSWSQVKQYDGKPKKSNSNAGFPDKIWLRGENETLEVVAFTEDMNRVMGALYNHDIPFGYIRTVQA